MENKKSDKKILITFISLILICGILGYFVVYGAAHIEKSQNLKLFFHMLTDKIIWIIPWLFLGTNVVGGIVSFYRILHIKKLVISNDEMEEEMLDTIENGLNMPMMLSSIITILNLFFFSTMIQIMEFTEVKESVFINEMNVLTDVSFIGGIIWTIWAQKIIIDIYKLINPEKRGNVLDIGFRKEWEGSCDEAQMQNIYQSGYAAYKAASTSCMILWMLSIPAQLVLKTGIYPSLIISVIWLVLIVTFSLYSAKLERGTNK